MIYMVTVVATDGEITATRDVTVTVTNVNEPGAVTLPTTRPQVGTAITANLTDDDGMVSNVRWEWARSESMGGSYNGHPGNHDGRVHAGGGGREYVPAGNGVLHRRAWFR